MALRIEVCPYRIVDNKQVVFDDRREYLKACQELPYPLLRWTVQGSDSLAEQPKYGVQIETVRSELNKLGLVEKDQK
jgi:hypothetical protein